jgi:hypothetical protein
LNDRFSSSTYSKVTKVDETTMLLFVIFLIAKHCQQHTHTHSSQPTRHNPTKHSQHSNTHTHSIKTVQQPWKYTTDRPSGVGSARGVLVVVLFAVIAAAAVVVIVGVGRIWGWVVSCPSTTC